MRIPVPTGAQAIRWSTVLAVATVAAVAGWVSYDHCLAVVRSHGEAGPVARLYPATVDGLIFAASMVLLDSARRKVPAPALARWLLAAGIAATLTVNVLSGVRYHFLGAVVAAWPALALVGSYELLMALVRGSAARPVPAVVQASQPAPADVPEAVRLAHLAAQAAGEPVSQRQLAERFGVSRRQVSQALAHLNGHAPAEPMVG